MSGEREMGRGGGKKIGRPEGCGYRGQNVFTGKCDVRLSADQDNAVTRLAERYGISRSDVMRKALDQLVKWVEE